MKKRTNESSCHKIILCVFFFHFKSYQKTDVELTKYNKLPMEEIANKFDFNQKINEISNQNKIDIEGNVKVSAMAEILASKFAVEQNVNQTPVKKVVCII